METKKFSQKIKHSHALNALIFFTFAVATLSIFMITVQLSVAKTLPKVLVVSMAVSPSPTSAASPTPTPIATPLPSVSLAVVNNHSTVVGQELSFLVSGSGVAEGSMSFTSNPLPAGARFLPLGDLTLNGSLSALDGLYTSEFLNGTRTFSPAQQLLADVNRDGSITSVDSNLILNIVVGNERPRNANVFVWTPTADQNGAHMLQFTASAAGFASATTVVTVEVSVTPSPAATASPSPSPTPTPTPTITLIAISNITISNITYNSANINWNTNLPASGYVIYSKYSNVPAGSSYSQEFGEYATAHSLSLTGLKAQKKYYFKIDSWVTLSNRVVSEIGYFTTLAAPQPVVTPTPTPSPTPSPTPTVTPSPTPKPTVSPTPTPTLSPLPSPSPTPTPTPSPTPSPTPTVTPSPTPKPTVSPTPTPTQTPIQQPPIITSTTKFLRGDLNGDGKIDISDSTVLPDFLYLGRAVPPCLDAADVNDDGNLNLTDWIVWMNWFNGINGRGQEFPAPGTKIMGVDPTADALGCEKYPVAAPAPITTPAVSFKRGDINSDGKIDITDIFALSQFLNEGQPLSCYKAADVNDDGRIDISDFVYWLGWFARGGEEPKAPGTRVAGVDPTADQLTCNEYPRTSPTSTASPTPAPVQILPTDRRPNILNVRVTNITSNTAVINWTTDTNADATVWYGTTDTIDGRSFKAPYGNTQSPLGIEHSITLQGLSSNTIYFYRVLSNTMRNSSLVNESISLRFTTLQETVGVKFLRGDINADGKIDITDMFTLSQYYNEGVPISCLDAADVNDDGRIDISDIVYFSVWFHQGGAEPKAPGTKIPGIDPTPDALGCGT